MKWYSLNYKHISDQSGDFFHREWFLDSIIEAETKRKAMNKAKKEATRKGKRKPLFGGQFGAIMLSESEFYNSSWSSLEK
jgi:hypothetical protein